MARRRLCAEAVAFGAGKGLKGAQAVEAWTQMRGPDVARIRKSAGEIAGSGLTLSKLSVVASLLGDLTRG